MQLIKQSHEIIDITDKRFNPIKWMTDANALCKKEDTTPRSMGDISVKFITDNLVAQKLLLNEGLYLLLTDSKIYPSFKEEIEFIIPMWLIDEIKYIGVITEKEATKTLWASHNTNFLINGVKVSTTESWAFLSSIARSEFDYKSLISQGVPPEEAHIVLPFALKTEITIKGEISQWIRLMLVSSISKPSQMKELLVPLLKELKERIPVIFDDLKL